MPSINRSPTNIGLIGVGLLGTALAERLLVGTAKVVGYDLDPAKGENLVQLGGEAAASVAEVFQACDRVITCLPNSTIVANVLHEAESYLRANTAIIDTSTGDPADTQRTAAKLAKRRVSYIDATIVGSSAEARAGHAVLLVGGDDEAIQSVLPILDAISPHRFLLGPPGSGAKMKLVVNLVLGLNRAVLAEGLAFARSIGFDLQQVLTVLRAGTAYSRVMDTKGPRMLTGDFAPVAKLSQHLKDVRLILNQGRRHRAKLPLSKLHRKLLEQAEADGWGEYDNSAILRVFE